ncbi:phenylacetate-CoA oxygenase subunit PaaI [Snodgrassella alvi]|uniref:phenylacetate-CoA oxygenase subunit PaaI n=1 Tax=Snodgrassella alvi TaxID=1196083 RepID=UPI00214977AC|nr:phenylacetate-CoA oxygenase subunit PaaI [Snodgrassella alvi]
MIQETGTNQHSSLYIYTDQSSYEPLARIDKRGIRCLRFTLRLGFNWQYIQ